MEILGIVPARAGSKRLPGKNIIPLNGKPMIEYTIESAIDSGYLDKIVITSDMEEVEQITNYYIKKQFIKDRIEFNQRPSFLAKDLTPMQEVVDYIRKEYPHKTTVLLQSTSPLRSTKWIDKCIEVYNKSNFDSVVTVKEVAPAVQALTIVAFSVTNKFQFLTPRFVVSNVYPHFPYLKTRPSPHTKRVPNSYLCVELTAFLACPTPPIPILASMGA